MSSAVFRLGSRLIASQKSFRNIHQLAINQDILSTNRLSQIQLPSIVNLGFFSHSVAPANYSTKSFLQQAGKAETEQESKYLLKQHYHQQNQIRMFSDTKIEEKGKLNAKAITKNLTYITNKAKNIEIDRKTMILKQPIDAPLCIMFSYMLAKKKHLLKYANIYTDLGFDVFIIELTPWQLLWPTKGSQLVATDALNFLYNNTCFAPMIIHGFSVGGYQWGELMAIMSRDLPKYQPFLDRIHAQVWDSAADITEIPVGVPKAIFPKNRTLENALRNYVVYHLKTFHQVATIHYARSSNFFHFPLLKCPALFLVSDSDVIGPPKSNWSVKEDMESVGIKTTWKCWEKSPHVMHFLTYPEEYMEQIVKHLKETNVLEDVAQKYKRAKL